MIPSGSEPVLIQGPVSKRGKSDPETLSVAGIGLWWKKSFLRLTPSFLTMTDLKQRTLLASIPTTDFQCCAHVKTNRTRGRRFLLSLMDGSVLQLYTATTGECVQWVSVINEVIVACDKQRAKNQLINQRRKEQLRDQQLQSSASLPNIMAGIMPLTPSGMQTHTLTHTPLMPASASPTRAQTAVVPSPHSPPQSLHAASPPPGKHVSLQLAGGATPGAPVGLVRASSTGAVVEQRRLERKTSRELEKREGRLKQAHDTGGAGTGSEPRRGVDGRVNGIGNGKERGASAGGERREDRRRRDEDYYSGYESYDRRHQQSSRDASDDEYHHHSDRNGSGNGNGNGNGRHSSRYYDDHPALPYGYPYPPSFLPPPYPPHLLSPHLLPPPVNSAAPNHLKHQLQPAHHSQPSPPPPPPTQRLLFFFLLFLLFSFTILLSGHTYRTSAALRTLYARHVVAPSAVLYPYRGVVGAVVECWPFYGVVVSGCYLLYMLQASMWDSGVQKRTKGGGAVGADAVDWLGGGMAGVVCTGCLYYIATHLRSYYDVFM